MAVAYTYLHRQKVKKKTKPKYFLKCIYTRDVWRLKAGLVDQRGTLCLLRGLEYFELDCFDTINGIYTCNTAN